MPNLSKRFEMMEERRKFMSDTSEEGKKQYKNLTKKLRSLREKAREEWIEGQCMEEKDLER